MERVLRGGAHFTPRLVIGVLETPPEALIRHDDVLLEDAPEGRGTHHACRPRSVEGEETGRQCDVHIPGAVVRCTL